MGLRGAVGCSESGADSGLLTQKDHWMCWQGARIVPEARKISEHSCGTVIEDIENLQVHKDMAVIMQIMHQSN